MQLAISFIYLKIYNNKYENVQEDFKLDKRIK